MQLIPKRNDWQNLADVKRGKFMVVRPRMPSSEIQLRAYSNWKKRESGKSPLGIAANSKNGELVNENTPWVGKALKSLFAWHGTNPR